MNRVVTRTRALLFISDPGVRVCFWRRESTGARVGGVDCVEAHRTARSPRHAVPRSLLPETHAQLHLVSLSSQNPKRHSHDIVAWLFPPECTLC